jgi:putative hemolysin
MDRLHRGSGWLGRHAVSCRVCASASPGPCSRLSGSLRDAPRCSRTPALHRTPSRPSTCALGRCVLPGGRLAPSGRGSRPERGAVQVSSPVGQLKTQCPLAPPATPSRPSTCALGRCVLPGGQVCDLPALCRIPARCPSGRHTWAGVLVIFQGCPAAQAMCDPFSHILAGEAPTASSLLPREAAGGFRRLGSSRLRQP